MKYDKNGGYIYETKEANEKSKAADLVTLPSNLQRGINCSNCIFFKKTNDVRGECEHPKVLLPVTNTMCCSFQDSKGMLRNYKPVGERETK